ncbi:unnamed protein product [Candidula unifasciata]|uniref:Sugar phosphate exchanger 3 n=1 Tax=Candidula unifasciata TaxID=100452 RepID=A0A8S3YP78_9EUPU|nr:unnamed protein product [Candidula unifasciata]
MTAPILIRVLPGLVTHNHRDLLYRWFILAFTFLCYTSYHLSRKPISVVKSVLHRDNCSTVKHSQSINTSNEYWCDWPPFNGSNGLDLLGALDLCYLISYAVAMFLSGHIADRMNLRYYLSAGMILSAIFTIAFGLGYFFDVHTFSFYVIIQVIGGVFQATGWPGVVACVGNWFGKGKRGLIMGIWNAHTSVGNILGSFIAGAFVEDNWGLSFVVPGIFIGVVGILVFLFLVPHPQDVNCKLPDHSDSRKVNIVSRNVDTEADTEEERVIRLGEDTALISKHRHVSSKEKPISILKALTIPGVIEFSLCLFFAKLVSYTFLYWLPKYLSQSVNATQAAYVSTIFDVGGILGGILAGYISDKYRMRGTTCIIFLVLVAPLLFLYNEYGTSIPFWANCLLLAVCGVGVNGPYALITTAVSADLGTHKTVRGNAKALGMVTAIIDGTGSIGAAIGPLLTGVISSSSPKEGWKYVFYMLIAADFVAALFLGRVMKKEIQNRIRGVDEDDITVIIPKSPEES